MEPQVVVKLQGGLGNLMFLVATFESFSYITKKQVAYTNFKEQALDYYKQGRHTFPSYPSNILNKIHKNLDFQTQIDRKLIEENEYIKDLAILLGEEKTFFVGYMQNHNNFISRKFIKNLFCFDRIDLQKEYMDLLQNKKCTSIHVRRGDYLGIQHILPCPDMSYYQSAVRLLGDHEHFVIFSDDPSWCKTAFSDVPNKTIVEENELVSLKMMTMCTKHIIANSSFSWWGAYLSDSDDVVIPSRWNGPAITNPRPIQHYKLENWNTI